MSKAATRTGRAVALTMAAAAALACAGLLGRGGDSAVEQEIDALEGTAIATDATPLPTLVFDGSVAAAPEFDEGDGVQILHAAPYGPGQKAVQVAVVFDRPMIALTDLDTMTGSVPLSCTPDVGAKARWAGTSTAVLVPPDGAFPSATRFECSLPAGTAAVDGTKLEKGVSWWFETPRPRVVGSSPGNGAEEIDPAAPIELVFDQPVDPEAVAAHVVLRDATGRQVAVRGKRGSSDQRVEITGDLAKNSAYTLKVTEGVPGVEGPLPSDQPFSMSFQTYPPIDVELIDPTDEVSPAARLELQFTTRVTRDEVAEHLSIEPRPDDWSPPTGDWDWREYSYGMRLAPRTEYTVRLSAGVEDVHGQKLAEDRSWTFRTGDYDPWLDVPQGLKLYAANNPPDLPFKHLNATRVDAVAFRVDPATLDDPRSWSKLVDAGFRDPSRARTLPVEVDPTPNRVELEEVGITSLLEGGHGWVATQFSAPNVLNWNGNVALKRGLFVVTDLGGTLKVGPEATEVWVTSLATGAPVEGAKVELLVGKEVAGTGTTAKNGSVRIEGVPAKGWSRWEEPVWARIRKGTDTSMVLSDWDDGLEPYSFGVYGSAFQARQVVSHGFADRGVYRLGEPVYARATFRVQSAHGLERPRGAANWRLKDPEGTEVAEGSASLDDRGGISIETALPADGPLGEYSIVVLASGEGWDAGETIAVPARAYRPPAFRVEVAAPGSAVAGQEVKATASVRYLFGAPLKKARVRWRAWTEDRWFAPEGWDGWTFGEEDAWWDGEDEESGTATLGSEEGEVADGETTFAQVVERGFRDRPVDLFLEAEVTDVDDQVIANRSTTRVHPAAFYVGLKSDRTLPKAGEPVTVQVVAVGPDGDKRAETVAVKVVRREWSSVREKGMDGRWRWVNTPEDTPVATEQVSTGTGSPATVSFEPEKSGYHVVVATAKDRQGNETKSELGLYVVGKGYVGWGRRDDNHMELVPERRKWKPGETARILVKAPVEGLNALVTVEREGVLWKRVMKLDGTAATVEVPITGAYRPNVFVSVVAVQGAGPQDAPDKGRPQVYMGLTELLVDAGDQRLDVAITPTADVYRPRDEVEVEIAVKRAGVPLAGAGVTLFAVDEAILSLTAYQTPNAFDTFYRHHGLSVLTADGRVSAVDRAAYLTKGANRGGGGGLEESGPEVRSRFVTTVTWQPDLKTGPDGRVKAKFQLPDNLTTFRIMAVADAEATAFGSADREIRVTRPLIVRPALPRILRQDDRAYAGVVVHNNAERDRWVRVTAETRGPVDLSGSPADVKVPAGGAVEVPFAIRALELGSAKFTFTASSGNDRDAVEWPLEIEREIPLDTVATSGRVEPGKGTTEQIAEPDGVHDAWGGLTVDVATTALVGVGSGLGYLRSYPHECAEQLTSRTLGNLMALAVRERAGLDLAEDTLTSDVEAGIAKLKKYRAPGGGLGYWQGSRWSSVMATAYGVELLGRAREAGFDVDQELLDDLAGYLRDVVSGRTAPPTDWRSDPAVGLVGKTYIAVALARAGRGDAGLNNELFVRRGQLSVFGTASLLEAIARTTGADGRTSELARTLAARSYVEPAAASIKETDSDRWGRLWGSDDLSTAAALEALVRAGSDNPLIPKYAVHLASSKVGDRWANTRATAGVLAALVAYADKYEAAAGGEVEPQVTLAGAPLLSKAVPVPGTASQHVPMAKLTSGPLKVSARGGPLYYEARLAYAMKDPPPRDEGLAVQRTLEVVDGGGPDGRVVEGALVRVTLTVVTPVMRHDVAVRDPIPAGLEPVDTSLATTSRAPDEGDHDEETLYDLGYGDRYEDRTDELPDYGGSWVFDHHEIDDAEVRLYASVMPPGVHTFRYLVRATTPGTYAHPPATAEEMYEPENFGRTKTGTLTVGGADDEAVAEP